ncbi:MAG: CoA transferase, partial [Chloroflexi bacterium]|nr:CoA transferase [Chloroflexota bacterium]
GAIAILAALDYRRRTGKGQHIDLSQFEAGVSYLAAAILDYTVNGNSQTRRGNRSSQAAPHAAYPCLGHEQWCTIAVMTEDHWQGLRRVMGDPGWSASPRFASLSLRKENEDELDVLVASWTIGLSADEVMLRLQAEGVPAGVVQTNKDLVTKDPHLKARGFFSYPEQPEIGPTLVPREPMIMSRTPAECRRAPLLGEDTESFCRDVLGISEAELAALKADGALQ